MGTLQGRREAGIARASGGITKECARTLHRAHHGLLAQAEPYTEPFQQLAPEMGPQQVPEQLEEHEEAQESAGRIERLLALTLILSFQCADWN